MPTRIPKHRGRKSSSKPVRLVCSKCGHEWDYYGKRSRYGTNCPVCHSWVTIPAHIREIPPQQAPKTQRRRRIPPKPGVLLRCSKCGYQWIYTGKYVSDIVAGKRVHLMISCPKCLYRISVPPKQQYLGYC